MGKHLTYDDYLSYACDIGSGMIKSGAEINRVEDTVKRILSYFCANDVDVFATPYSLIATVEFEDKTYTQSRRIAGFSYNLESLALYNSLSRRICEGKIDPKDISLEITKIKSNKGASNFRIILAYFLIGSAFCSFFGGSLQDSFIAGFIAIAMGLVERLLKSLKINRFIIISICGFAIAYITRIVVDLSIGSSRELISIGITMILISGLLFTNSFKEMFMDNILTGAVKLFEALFIASAIYIGFALAYLMN